MKTSVTKKGQTVIPSAIRKRYSIDETASLEWIDSGGEIKVVPIPKDVIGSLRGIAKGEKLCEKMLKERRLDGDRE